MNDWSKKSYDEIMADLRQAQKEAEKLKAVKIKWFLARHRRVEFGACKVQRYFKASYSGACFLLMELQRDGKVEHDPKRPYIFRVKF